MPYGIGEIFEIPSLELMQGWHISSWSWSGSQRGVFNRTEAIQHRIDTAGLRCKVGKNQTKAIRIILTGTHEQMMKIANGGRLDSWIDDNRYIR